MFQIDTTGRTRGHSLKLVKCRCNKDIGKYFFSHRVVSKWNMLDNDSVMEKIVNGFKTKLERERAKKMGLFSDWCLLDLGAVTGFRSGHPASILLVTSVTIISPAAEASTSFKARPPLVLRLRPKFWPRAGLGGLIILKHDLLFI